MAFSVPTEPEHLRPWLAARGVPVEQWGQGEAKSVEHLARELAAGESQLREQASGGLIRYAEGATLTLRYQQDGQPLILVEDHQEFLDGRDAPIKRRGLRYIGEKLSPGEDPQAAAYRALAEELGLELRPALEPLEETSKTAESVSYPGLTTVYRMFHFQAQMPAEGFRAEGYVEEQPDKRSVFVWQPDETVTA